MTETSTSGSTQDFTWDTMGLIGDGTDAYIYGPELSTAPVEQINLSSGAVSYLSSIPSGIHLAFDQTGTHVTETAYSTYGIATSTTTTNGPTTPFGFEGGYTDPNGLIFLMNRYYDPATAQFISVDPLVAKTAQPYSYAGDNPINASDPSGLMESLGSAGWGALAGLAALVQQQRAFYEGILYQAQLASFYNAIIASEEQAAWNAFHPAVESIAVQASHSATLLNGNPTVTLQAVVTASGSANPLITFGLDGSVTMTAGEGGSSLTVAPEGLTASVATRADIQIGLFASTSDFTQLKAFTVSASRTFSVGPDTVTFFFSETVSYRDESGGLSNREIAGALAWVGAIVLVPEGTPFIAPVLATG